MLWPVKHVYRISLMRFMFIIAAATVVSQMTHVKLSKCEKTEKSKLTLQIPHRTGEYIKTLHLIPVHPVLFVMLVALPSIINPLTHKVTVTGNHWYTVPEVNMVTVVGCTFNPTKHSPTVIMLHGQYYALESQKSWHMKNTNINIQL